MAAGEGATAALVAVVLRFGAEPEERVRGAGGGVEGRGGAAEGVGETARGGILGLVAGDVAALAAEGAVVDVGEGGARTAEDRGGAGNERPRVVAVVGSGGDGDSGVVGVAGAATVVCGSGEETKGAGSVRDLRASCSCCHCAADTDSLLLHLLSSPFVFVVAGAPIGGGGTGVALLAGGGGIIVEPRRVP